VKKRSTWNDSEENLSWGAVADPGIEVYRGKI
jgi:hypothetical protein